LKKLLLIILFAATTAATSFGQTKDSHQFSIALDAGKPIGKASDYYSSVFGGSVKYQMPIIEDDAFFTASLGYTSLSTSTTYKKLDVPSSFGFVPLKAGVKDYLYKGLYTGVEIGAVFGTTSGFGNKFTYSVNTGYSFSLIEIGLRYESWVNDLQPINQLAVHLGFRFN
jgi:hypothetical protein